MFGAGTIELAFVGPLVTHIGFFWTIPEFKAFFEAFFERHGTYCRVALYDEAVASRTPWLVRGRVRLARPAAANSPDRVSR